MAEPGIQVLLSAGIPTLAVLAGILINNSRLGDLRVSMNDLGSHVDARFNSMEALFDAKLRRVEEVFDARLTRIEQELR
jgi:hypothetical protein